MDNYTVKIFPQAGRELDRIYHYFATEFVAPDTAEKLVNDIEEAILGLDFMPYRGRERTVGTFANKGYREIHVKNFTIVYRISEKLKQVVIVTVRYTPSQF